MIREIYVGIKKKKKTFVRFDKSLEDVRVFLRKNCTSDKK